MDIINKIDNYLNESLDEIAFCKKHCKKITREQEVMITANVKKGTFIGVGRPLGRSFYFPMVLIGNKRNVIDEKGYYQLASDDGDGIVFSKQDWKKVANKMTLKDAGTEKPKNDWNKLLNKMR